MIENFFPYIVLYPVPVYDQNNSKYLFLELHKRSHWNKSKF